MEKKREVEDMEEEESKEEETQKSKAHSSLQNVE